MKHSPSTRFGMTGVATAIAALFMAMLVTAPASATPAAAPVVTGTTLGTWDVDYDGNQLADNTIIDQNLYNRRSVSGTSTGTTGDKIDVYCVAKDPANSAKLADNADIQANGNWSIDFQMIALYNATTTYTSGCRLAAVWHGASAPLYDTLTTSDHYLVYAHPYVHNGIVDDIWMEQGGPAGYTDWQSSEDCSLCDQYLTNPATGYAGRESVSSRNLIFYYNGVVSDRVDSMDHTLIDGHRSFPANQVNRRVPSAALNKRQHPVSFTLDKATGAMSFTETGQLSYCVDSSKGLADIGCNTDAGITASGVSFTRVTTLDPVHLTYWFEDSFESIDGNSHTVTIGYYEGNYTGYSGTSIKLPAGVSGATGGVWAAAGTTSGWTNVTGFGEGPTTVDFARDPNSAPAWNNAIAAVTYTYAPDRIVSTRGSRISAFYDNRTVTSSSPLHLGAAYVTAPSQALLDSYKEFLMGFAMSHYPQATVTWSPSTTVDTDATSLSALATTTGGALSYSVVDAGTTGCTIDAVTGAVAFTDEGTCVLRATAAASRTLRGNHVDVSLTVEPALKCTVPYIGKIEFAPGSAALTAGPKHKLERLVAQMIKARCGRIMLTGNAANVMGHDRSLSHRNDLAIARAKEVRTFIQHRFRMAGRNTVVKVRSAARLSVGHIDVTKLQKRMHSTVTITATS